MLLRFGVALDVFGRGAADDVAEGGGKVGRGGISKLCLSAADKVLLLLSF